MTALPATRRDDYHALYESFRWNVPEHFNLADVCCTRWARDPATASRIAVHTEHEDGRRASYTYAHIQAEANRLSRALREIGVRRGDRVAIVMPQRIETVIAGMAVYQLGAIAMPLSMLFGPEALAYRIDHSETRVAIGDETSIDNLLAARPECPTLKTVIGVGAATGRGDLDWDVLLAAQLPEFTAEQTKADEAAVLIYTSGTTGPPKGAVIPHRALIGNLTGFVCSQNWYPQDDDVFWSPADWAWTGGLMDALLPSLCFGRPILGYQGRFSPEKAFELMQHYRVSHTFLFPTALKAMMKAVPHPAEHYTLHLQAIMSAGEAVGDAVFDWGRRELGVTINEMFGQTEINYVVGNCARLWPAKPGSMGRAYPGHRVAVIDDEGQVCPPGQIGEVAVHRRDAQGTPDPIFFLGYWRNEAATAAKFTGDPADSWCRTGDLARADEDGYLWYQGRDDDQFKVAGYRIGPGEIENCLVRHEAVANAAVVPKPDAERGALVKAFVVLAPGRQPSAALTAELQDFVKQRLAPYEYPKEIEFLDALPMTTTGKVQRRVLRQLEADRATGRVV